MTTTPRPADAEARALADRFWDAMLELEPLLGTSVGDERFDDRLSDPSEEGLAARAAVYRTALQDAQAMDRDALSQTERTTLDVLEAIASRELAGIESRIDRLQVASHLWGPAQLVGEVASLQRADTPERLERYLARLRAMPSFFAALEPILRDAAAAGQTSPAVVVDRAIAQVERLLAAPLEESPALAPVASDPEATAAVSAVLVEDVLPAHQRYLEALKEHRPSATESIGLGALPGGDRMYAAQILSWTTLPLGAQEVHDLGHAELSKIQAERVEVARRLGFDDPAAAIEAHNAANHAASREAMVQIARDQVERGWEAAPAMFGRLPSANCEVRAVEEFREADMPFAFYNPPTADGSRAGVYYINTLEPEHGRCTSSPAPRTTRRTPATTSRSASSTTWPTGRRSAASAASSPAARSSRAGACTASGSRTRWGCIRTTTSSWACSTHRRSAPTGSSSTPASTRWAGTASGRSSR